MFNENPEINMNIALIDKCIVFSSPLYEITIIHNKKEIPKGIKANTAVGVKYIRYFQQGYGELILKDVDDLVYKIVSYAKNNKPVQEPFNELLEILYKEALKNEIKL